MKVEWTGEALDRLAGLMVTSDMARQAEVEQCVRRVKAILATDSWELGESRDGVGLGFGFIPQSPWCSGSSTLTTL